MTEYKITFTNNSENYLVVGNGSEILFEGTKDEAEKYYNDFNIDCSAYGVLEIVAPNETVSHNMVNGSKATFSLAGLLKQINK